MGFLVIFGGISLLFLVLAITAHRKSWGKEPVTIFSTISIFVLVFFSAVFSTTLLASRNFDEQYLSTHNVLRESLQMIHEVDESIRIFVIKDITASNQKLKEAKKDNESWFYDWHTLDEFAEAELIEIPEEYRKMLIKLRLLGR